MDVSCNVVGNFNNPYLLSRPQDRDRICENTAMIWLGLGYLPATQITRLPDEGRFSHLSPIVCLPCGGTCLTHEYSAAVA